MQAAQKMEPHLRQCYMRNMGEYGFVGELGGGRRTHVSALEQRKADPAIEVVARGCEGVFLPQVFREEDCEVLVCP